MSLSVLAMSLGLLGAVIYQIFNIIGVLKERAFSIEDVYANILRILLGPAIGWVFYYGFVRETNPGTNGSPAQQNNLVLLLLPFFAGFSTKLVTGIMDKTIQSIMLIFGIEDKRADTLVRERRHQETATAVPPGGGKGTGGKTSESQGGNDDNPPPAGNGSPRPDSHRVPTLAAARMAARALGRGVCVRRVLAVVAAIAPLARDHAVAPLVRALLLVGSHGVCHLNLLP